VDKHIKSVLSIYSILLSCNCIIGQITIDSIEISDTKPFIYHLQNSDYKNNDTFSLSTQDFLQKITSGQLQLSTPGGLMTFLHRGMGNRHLPVLWHGVNLQSIVNGSYDLGLIPIGLMDDISFYAVGSPTLQGNNGFAGALNIQSGLLTKPNSLKIYSQFSTLHNYSFGLKSKHQLGKWSSNIGLEIGKDQNTFSYIYNQKKETRSNTDFDKINLVINLDYFHKPSSIWSLNFWWQSSDRLIPVSVTSAPTQQSQEDKNLRTQISHQLFGKKHRLKSSLSYLHENLNFKTPGIDSRAKVDVFVTTLEWSEIKNKSYLLTFKHRRDRAYPNFYSETKSRSTTQLGMAKKIKLTNKIISEISLRQDVVDRQWMPLSLTIQSIYKNTGLIISRNYNLPGFNDLYWPSGGNPTLNTENSIQAEIKTKVFLKNWDFKLASYGQVVDDWIQWLPQTSGIWSPSNQKKVFSRGMEMKAETSLMWINIHWKPTLLYAFNKTTSLDHYFDPTLIGKQLIYIPIYKGGLNLTATFHGHQIQLDYQLTGQRFDVSDESQALDAIHLVSLNYTTMLDKFHITIGLNNVLNTQYQYVRFFPMPGINANTKITYNIF
jgi:vitamin B12 transporter